MKIHGYVLVENAIPDPRLVAALRADIDRAIADDLAVAASGRPPSRFGDIVHLLLNRGESFVELLEHCELLDTIDLLLGETCILHSYNAVRLMPGRGNNATRVHRDSPRYSPDYLLAVQVLYFVDDFTDENGGTWLLPGSHNASDRPTDEQFYERAIQVTGKAGSALILDSSVWHAGGENRTDQPRRGITMVFTRAFMKQQIDLPRAAGASVVARLSERGRRLLGFNVRVPASLDEFNLPDDQRLYKPNQG
jgi:ectoine hydroxylase-related dioxygenase (phytanoyl-CoA dioxygenase family)